MAMQKIDTVLGGGQPSVKPKPTPDANPAQRVTNPAQRVTNPAQRVTNPAQRGAKAAQDTPQQGAQVQVPSPKPATQTVEQITKPVSTGQSEARISAAATARAQERAAKIEQERAAKAAKDAKEAKITQLKAAYDDTSGKSAIDIFRETRGGTGGSYASGQLAKAWRETEAFYTKSVEPAYASYEKLLTAYQAGDATAEDLESARREYASLYYQYTPMRDALMTARQGNALNGAEDADLEDLQARIEHWSVAGEVAAETLGRSAESLKVLDESYSKALGELNANPTPDNIAKLNAIATAYEEAAGKYNADQFVLQIIGDVQTSLTDQYNSTAKKMQEQFYADNPYVLRPDDTAESIAARAADTKANYEKALSALNEAEKKYTADSDVEAFGLPGAATESKAAYEAARDEYVKAWLIYSQTQTLNDWSSDPDNLISREEWTRNDWTWDERFNLYLQTGDKDILDDLVYGYGNFAATEEQRERLTEVLRQEFNEAKSNRFWDGMKVTSTRRTDPELESVYREAQARMHQMGQKATSLNDLVTATGLVIASDYASLGSLAFDAASAFASLIGGKTELLDLLSSNIKAERIAAQETMAREVAGMSYAEGMAVQLAPSVVECLISMLGAEALLGNGAAAADGTTSGLLQASRLAQNMTKAEEFLNIASMTMKDMAANPQYWTSFARVAGTDYVDAVNEGASQTQAMVYAIADGSLNALIEIGGGGIQSLPYTLETLDSPTFRKAFKDAVLKSSFEEGMEEVYQGIVERGLSAVLLNQNREIASFTDKEAIFSFTAALEEFIGGAAVSLVVGLPRGVGKMREGAERDRFIKDLNRANQQLPEDMRLPAIDAETATDLEVQDYAQAVGLRSIIVQATEQVAGKRRAAEAGLSEEEILQLRIEAANPDKAVLDTMASTIQEKGYGDAVKAQEQADLIRKTLEGETLTSEEAKRLDLNNPAVRDVFIERTGLTGLPTNGNLNTEAVRAYAEVATRVAQDAKAALQEIQTAQAARVQTETNANPEANTTTSAPATDTDLSTAKSIDIFKRKARKAIRDARGRDAQKAAVEQNQRHRDIKTEGRTLEQVFKGVQRQSGVDSIMTYEEWRKSDLARRAMVGVTEEEKAFASISERGYYYNYLTGLGLTRAEADAIMRVQPLTKAEAETYNESKTAKEDMKNGGGETTDDGGDPGNSGRGGGEALPNGAARGGSASGTGSEAVSGAESEQPGVGADSPKNSDSAGPKASGEPPQTRGADNRLTSFTPEEKALIKEHDPNATIDYWTDAPVSQLSETEASIFTAQTEWLVNLTGAKVFFVNTEGRGTYMEYNPDAKQNAVCFGVTLRGNPSGVFVAADLQDLKGFSPAMTLTHEGFHAMFRKFGRKELLGKLRETVDSNPGIVKDFERFKETPAGKFYDERYKGREDIVYEEFAAKIFAHQYGDPTLWRMVERFVEANIPGFPMAEYRKQMNRIEELYFSPKTVDEFIDKKPGAPEGVTPPPESSRPAAPAKVSPQARALAEQNGIDLAKLTGSGKDGRILVADVRAAIQPKTEAPAAKTETKQTEAPKTDAPIKVLTADETKAIKAVQEAGAKNEKPTTVRPAEAKAEAPKDETPIRVLPATPKTEAPKTEAPKTEAPTAKTDAPIRVPTADEVKARKEARAAAKSEAPATVRPAEARAETVVKDAPIGLTAAQQKRIPKALARLEARNVDSIYQTLIDTLVPEDGTRKYVGLAGAEAKAGKMWSSLQNLLNTFGNADILYAQGRGIRTRDSKFMNNGTLDAELRRGYSIVSLDPATRAELHSIPGLLPADGHSTKETQAEAQQRLIYFRTGQAIFDQAAYAIANTAWRSSGKQGNSDQGLILERIYKKLGPKGGLTPADIAKIRSDAYRLYTDKAVEYGVLHDNYRTISTTSTNVVGDRLAELRSTVARASALDKAKRLGGVTAEQMTELINSECAAIDSMGSFADLARDLANKGYISGSDADAVYSLEQRQKTYGIASDAEVEGAYRYEEQVSTSDRGDEASELEKIVNPDARAVPAATIFDQASEDSMMQGFRRWAEYQLMRDVFAYSHLMKALGGTVADTYKGTDFDAIARRIQPGMDAVLSPRSLYSKRTAATILDKESKVQAIQNEIIGTMREWTANNLWQDMPWFARPGKDAKSAELGVIDMFETAHEYRNALLDHTEQLKAARAEARRLARALDDYNRAAELGMDPTIGASEAAIEAESKFKEGRASDISRMHQARGAVEDEANLIEQIEETADRGVRETRVEEMQGVDPDNLQTDPAVTLTEQTNDLDTFEAEVGMGEAPDSFAYMAENFQNDPDYLALLQEELYKRGIRSREEATDTELVSEAIWEAEQRYKAKIGEGDTSAYLEDERFKEILREKLAEKEIPAEPKKGTAAQASWEKQYGAKWRAVFNEAVTAYRDESRSATGTKKVYGETIMKQLGEINAEIKRLIGAIQSDVKAGKNYASKPESHPLVPAGASTYLVQNLLERVASGQMTVQQATNATKAAQLLWAKDNTITADQILGIPAEMFTANPNARINALSAAANRVDIEKIGQSLYRDAVSRAVEPERLRKRNKRGHQPSITEEDIEVLHDMVPAEDAVTVESETNAENRRAGVVKVLDEANKTEVNDANDIRAEFVKGSRAAGVTELDGPVGLTDTTEVYKVTPDALASEAEAAKSGKPIRVPVRDSSSVAKRFELSDLNVGDPYSKKRKKFSLSKTPKEILHLVDRLGFNDCEAVARASMKQSRMDNLINHITLVRGSSATAGAILTDALVDPNGDVIGSSFADVFLCRDKVHPKQIDREAQNTLETYFLLNMTIDRMSSEVRADRAVADYEALYPEVCKLTPEQIEQYREINPIIGKYAQLLLWQRGAKNKPVLAVNDTFDDGTPIPLSAEDATRMLNQLQSENPWLEAKANAFYDWWDLFMRTYVVGGAVSEQDYDNIRNAAPHYVPTHREGHTGAIAKEYAEMLSSFSKTMNVGAALKPAKGSTKRVEPIADQMAALIGTYVKSYRSRALVNNFFDELLVDDTGTFSEFGRIVWSKTDPVFQQANGMNSEDTGATVGEVSGEDGGYYLATWRDGKKIVAYLTEEMYHSMNNLIGKGYKNVQKIMNVSNAVTGPMKSAITGVNVWFTARNVARDVPTAYVNTENSFPAYFMGWGEACAHIAQNSDLWRVYCALGGEHANINYRDKGLVNAIDDPGFAKKVAKGTMDVISYLGETTESVTRFAEFLATIRKMGDTPTTRMIAMHRAAEVTVDFSRAGYVSRFLNSMVPYFNPAVQGIAKVFRSVFESKTPGKTIGFNGKTVARGLFWSIAPEFLMQLWRKLADKEDEFNELSDYVKDGYYLIPAGDHRWIRIAKTREWAAVFGNATMRLMEGATGYENPFETYWDISIKGNFLPDFPLPLPLQMMRQIDRNKNYAGSVIIPQSFEDFMESHPMDVYDENTSALAYLIASVTSNVSAKLNPMAVDYLLEYYFGDFYSQLWQGLTWTNAKRWFDGEYDLFDFAGDTVQTFWDNTKKVFVVDDRYSNSTVTRYYEMYSQLKGDVAAAKYREGGATGSLDEAILAALSNQRYGYSALIQKLSKEARALPNGDEKAEIKGQIVALAHLAQDFYQRCQSGEITDPERWIKYHGLGEEVCDELVWLGEPETGYNPEDIDFDPSFSCPAYLRDPNNSGKQYKLTGDEGLRTEFITAYEANFAEAATALIRSSRYQSMSKTAKAAAMQQQESYALAQTKSEFAELLRKRGIASENKTLTSVELAKVEAEYVLQGINNPNLAIDDDVVGELIALDDYTSKYGFVLSTSVPPTFRSQTDSDYVYKLNARQQTYYATTRAALYNDAMTSVIASEGYRKATKQERAAMLEAACSYVDKELKAKMQTRLNSENAKPVRSASTSDELIDEAAKYSVGRILSPSNAYDAEVTDELLRLYGLSDDYSFQPPTNKPKSYVDPDDKSKEYILTEAQREKYVEISHATYNDAVLTIITDPSYARLTDAQKAERLNAMRDKLSGVVKNEFLYWLSLNTTSTDREEDKVSKETAAYVKALLGW